MAVKGGKIQKFLWKVENYSFCWNDTDDFIRSPEFRMDIFEGSAWCLKLYPKGVSAYEKYVSVHLERLESSLGPLGITVDYEISILRPDGTVEYMKETKDRCFRKGHAFGFDNLAVRDDILETKKSILLPQDVLTVQCLIFPKGAELKTCSEIIAKTRIELQRSVFLWKSVNNFPDRRYEHRRWFLPNSKAYATLKLYWPNDYLVMCFFEHNPSIKVMHYKVGILDCINSVSWILVDKRMEHKGTSDIFRIHRDEILKRKSLYLPNDKLTLHCDLTFSFGIQHSHIEKVYDEDALPYALESSLPFEVNVSPKNYVCHCTDNTSDSLKSDFQNLYQEEALCDFTLKVGNEVIKAHKAVLGARSPVFKAMLTSKMKENEKNLVHISDLDANTIRRMLAFMYTDTTGDLDWETASKLYLAADKYDIIKLKRFCTSVLVQNLCVSNVGEALTLANLHGDDELKNLTLEFVSSHETEVMCSMEWKAFMTEDAHLAAKAMHCIFMKKAENNRGGAT